VEDNYPAEMFQTMAQLLADVSHRNGSSFADYKYEEWQKIFPSSKCQDSSSKPCEICGDGHGEAHTSILCTDGESMDGITKGAYRNYWSILQEQSTVLGDSWAQIRLPDKIRLSCIGWKARPEWQYNVRPACVYLESSNVDMHKHV
jgi:hypothetical protein